jgi:hypothetical protein
LKLLLLLNLSHQAAAEPHQSSGCC